VDNIVKYNHQDEAFIVIVGDLKTPIQETAIAEKKGVSCFYFDVKMQKQFLKPYPKLAKAIPYNSDNRRNIGYLKAATLGADVIVSLDDDNFPLESEDLVGCHSTVNTYQRNLASLRSTNGWVNPCFLLSAYPSQLFMRGFPLSKRSGKTFFYGKTSGTVALNMGLWLGVPDLYAMTLLDFPNAYSHGLSTQVMIPKETMLPIDTQNTSFSAKMLPCYYFLKMGIGISRFDDIWQGYFAKKCIDAVGEAVTVGHPLVFHKKHEHNLPREIREEFAGMEVNERLIEVLEKIKLTSTSYADAYLELTDSLEENVEQLGSKRVENYFKRIVGIMRLWVDVCDKIGVQK